MKYDWKEIENEYITTKITIPKLAEKYNAPYRSVANKCCYEHWVEKREEYLKKKGRKVLEKVTEKVAAVESDKLIKAINIVDGFADQMQAMMKDNEQFKRALTRNDSGELVDVVTNKYDTKAMKEASEALKNLVELTRNVYNLPLNQEQQSNNNIEVIFRSDDFGKYSE